MTTAQEPQLQFDAEVRGLLAMAEEAGLTAVELYARRDTATTLRAFDGALESFQRSDSVGLGVRVWHGERVGYAYTENMAHTALRRTLDEAAANASLVEEMPGAALPATQPEAEGPRLFFPGMADVPLDAKIAKILELERLTRTGDPRVKSVPGCSYADVASVVRVANSRGVDRHYQANACHALVYPIVSEGGENKTSFEMDVQRDFALLDMPALSQRVLASALGRLGAREIATGAYPVVFSPRAMAELLSAFMDLFSARAAQDGKSLLAGRLGDHVASPLFTLVDDPLLATGFASRPFDDEGVPGRRITPIAGGVFQTFFHNTQTAGVAGGASTGHASRGGYKGVVGVAPSNMFVEPGEASFDAIVKVEGACVLIDDLQGLHAGTNTVSGDFSIAAQGHLYVDGALAHPVHNFTVAGNFLAMLAGVDAVGDTLRFFPHGAYLGSPHVRIAKLAIAGA